MVDRIPGYTRKLLVGIAELLDGEGIAKWRDPDGPSPLYLADEFGIVLQKPLPAFPARVISISFYMPEDSVQSDVATTRVQIKGRVGKNPLDALDAIDAIRDVLHRAQHHPFGEVVITGVRRESAGPLGPDANGMAEFSTNYRFTGLRWLHPVKTLPTGE